MAVATNDAALAQPVSNKQVLGAVLASCVGWSLDLFDLFILLFVAPIIGRLFFPSEHAMLSLAAVYASFGVTLLMRPLGSALFGSYADQHGRKRAMILRWSALAFQPHCSGRCQPYIRSASLRRSSSWLCAWCKGYSSVAWSLRRTRSVRNRWRQSGAVPAPDLSVVAVPAWGVARVGSVLPSVVDLPWRGLR